MTAQCTIQLHAGGRWRDAAVVRLRSDSGAGWRTAFRTGYVPDWAIDHLERADACALSCRLPVGLDDHVADHWPVFLIDCLPQGVGRRQLLVALGFSERAGPEADWPLLLNGAGNPVGNLRVREAAERMNAQPAQHRGFSVEEVALRGDDFSDHLAAHGVSVAGASGLQGEWPKLQLTQADDGLLYLDHALSDDQARTHYIVKFGWAHDERFGSILRHERVYMELARMLGLRVHASLALQGRALNIKRFDRVRGPTGELIRLGQESLASLTDEAGFSPAPSHDVACRQLLDHCSDPQGEILEYLRRDIANLALGNTDNHARNTAILRDFSGNVSLAPVFDFAPMVLHPDGVARCMRWQGNDGGAPNWMRVIESLCDADREIRGVNRKDAIDPHEMVRSLVALAPTLRVIAERAESMGIEPDLKAMIAPRIRLAVDSLEALSSVSGRTG